MGETLAGFLAAQRGRGPPAARSIQESYRRLGRRKASRELFEDVGGLPPRRAELAARMGMQPPIRSLGERIAERAQIARGELSAREAFRRPSASEVAAKERRRREEAKAQAEAQEAEQERQKWEGILGVSEAPAAMPETPAMPSPLGVPSMRGEFGGRTLGGPREPLPLGGMRGAYEGEELEQMPAEQFQLGQPVAPVAGPPAEVPEAEVTPTTLPDDLKKIILSAAPDDRDQALQDAMKEARTRKKESEAAKKVREQEAWLETAGLDPDLEAAVRAGVIKGGEARKEHGERRVQKRKEGREERALGIRERAAKAKRTLGEPKKKVDPEQIAEAVRLFLGMPAAQQQTWRQEMIVARGNGDKTASAFLATLALTPKRAQSGSFESQQRIRGE